MFTVALVDLDGTVMDSARGITSTLVQALEELGLPVPPADELVGFVGPPILDGLRDIAHLDGAESVRVLDRYRRLYRERGAFDAEPFPGIEDALDDLGRDLPLAIATSKPESVAVRILEHFGLAARFAVIAGASDDESRSEKAEVIAYCLDRLRAGGVDVARPVMVGDRVHDVAGAARHGVPTVFAGWGYGSPEEAAAAAAVAPTPEDLSSAVAALGRS